MSKQFECNIVQKRGELKLSIGGLNINIPYTVQKLSKVLQLAWSLQTHDSNMALNAEAREWNK